MIFAKPDTFVIVKQVLFFDRLQNIFMSRIKISLALLVWYYNSPLSLGLLWYSEKTPSTLRVLIFEATFFLLLLYLELLPYSRLANYFCLSMCTRYAKSALILTGIRLLNLGLKSAICSL